MKFHDFFQAIENAPDMPRIACASELLHRSVGSDVDIQFRADTMNNVRQRDSVVVGIQLRAPDVYDLAQKFFERLESGLRGEWKPFVDDHCLDLSIGQVATTASVYEPTRTVSYTKWVVLASKRVTVATLRFLAELRTMADDEHLEVRPRGLCRQHRFNNARQFLAKVFP